MGQCIGRSSKADRYILPPSPIKGQAQKENEFTQQQAQTKAVVDTKQVDGELQKQKEVNLQSTVELKRKPISEADQKKNTINSKTVLNSKRSVFSLKTEPHPQTDSRMAKLMQKDALLAFIYKRVSLNLSEQ